MWRAGLPFSASKPTKPITPFNKSLNHTRWVSGFRVEGLGFRATFGFNLASGPKPYTLQAQHPPRNLEHPAEQNPEPENPRTR